MTGWDKHIPSFRVSLSLELPNISRCFLAGESSNVGGRVFELPSAEVLLEGCPVEEDHALAGTAPCCSPSPVGPRPPGPSDLVDSRWLGSARFLVGILESAGVPGAGRVEGFLDRLDDENEWVYSMRS
jgi:hypothetical protein